MDIDDKTRDDIASAIRDVINEEARYEVIEPLDEDYLVTAVTRLLMNGTISPGQQFPRLVEENHRLKAKIQANSGVLASAIRRKDEAYAERDKLVAALSKLFPSHAMRHEGDDWEDDWRTIICVHLPAGTATWHVHDSERPMFGHVGYDPQCTWDGHSTQEKYERLAALAPEPRNAYMPAATMLRASRNCEDWPVPADVWDRGEDGKWMRLAGHNGLPVATMRRIGWLDQKGRVWVKMPSSLTFDGGSLTPLLIDAREGGI